MGLLNQDVLYLWSTPFFISIILIEIYFSYRNKAKNYDLKDTSTNVYFALINFSLDLLMKVISFGIMGICYHYKIINWENLGWAYWVFAFVGQDFLYYIHHYVDHHSRFFWAVHVTHHNSEYYNISTGFRSPVLQPLFRYMFFLPASFFRR